jgi:DNA modification methylase
MNQLILGDNLEILKSLESESIDLIYLDPPFFSNRNYEVIWGDAGEIRSFQDRWSGGIDHYIAWLKERVFEMHRLLKPTGSIFLHCDWHAASYIQVHVLDKIFGQQNFRNQIVWKRTTTHNDAKQGARQFGRVCDFIFFYNKDAKIAKFNSIYEEYATAYVESTYNKVDENGRRFKSSDLSAAKPGGNTSYLWKGVAPPKGRYWGFSIENMEQFEKEGKIYYSKTGKPYLKHYLDEMPGVSIDEFWSNCVFKSKEERIGYPTQKPEALLERIISCASNENDMILDPFVGGGTTVAVADKLKRNWIGIDQSVQAIKVSEMRLQKHQDLFSNPFVVQLHKYDYDTLRYKNAFAFETWIIQQLGGTPNLKQRNDLGIDGRSKDGLAIQVKRSDAIGREVIDKFQSACKRFDNNLFEKQVAAQQPVGIIIAFSFGKGAIQEVARLKNEENTIIQLLKVEEIVPIAKKPKLSVIFSDLGLDSKGGRDIEFTAQGESDAGIEFYAWDFSYQAEEGFKADVLIDKIGKQVEKFKIGAHTIAVKVVDNEGLENLELIQLKINGQVHSR